MTANAALQTFSWELLGRSTLREDIQFVIDAISGRCDSLSLTSFKLLQIGPIQEEEALDISLPDQLDISRLFKFQNLSVLRLSVLHSAFLTPDFFAGIPKSWPRLQQLVLSPALQTTHTTLITHKHILQLSLALPSLTELGVQFDATRVTEQPEEGKTEPQSKLRILHVAVSPIRSPSQVFTFLKCNFPNLERLVYALPQVGEGTLFARRWDAVVHAWNASRNRR